MAKEINYEYLIGQRFNKLLVISVGFINGRKKAECICDCGNIKFIRIDAIKKVKSCGCFWPDRNGINSNTFKDGRSKEKLYNVWFALRNGDYSPQNCVWATMTTQVRNRSNTLFVNYKGEIKTIKEWCNDFNLKYESERGKIHRHYKKTGEMKLSIQ